MTTDQMWESIQVRKEKVTEWIMLEDPKAFEEHLLRWTMLHHHQANNSPCLHPLYGVYHQLETIPSTEQEYQEWLEVLPNEKSSIDKLDIKLEGYRLYRSKKPEKKRTSPSGLHLGIYKALLQSKTLLKVSFTILSLAITHNVLLPRWLQTHQLLLQK